MCGICIYIYIYICVCVCVCHICLDYPESIAPKHVSCHNDSEVAQAKFASLPKLTCLCMLSSMSEVSHVNELRQTCMHSYCMDWSGKHVEQV